jgi:hypothetical protein
MVSSMRYLKKKNLMNKSFNLLLSAWIIYYFDFCLHSSGAAAASRLFNESLAKIAINAQQGGTTDIGKLCFT